MCYLASSTKERFDELQKNPLVFCKFGTVNVQDDMGYNHATEMPSCGSLPEAYKCVKRWFFYVSTI